MENLKINKLVLNNNSDLSNKLYLNYTINVVVSYLILKGCDIIVSENSKNNEINAVFCIDNVLISLRHCLLREIGYKESCMKAFLNQKDVTPDLYLETNLLKFFSKFTPRVVNLDLFLRFDSILYSELQIFECFLQGLEPFTMVPLLDWGDRVTALDNWLKTLSLDLTGEFKKEFYELSVANIEKKIQPYYMFSSRLVCDNTSVYLKLTKEQYLRFFRFFVSYGYFYRSYRFYVDLLKVKIVNVYDLAPGDGRNFHLPMIFPDIFEEFDLTSWDIVQDFDNYHLYMKILKNYAVKIMFKHFEFLQKFLEINSEFLTNSEESKHINNNQEIIKNIILGLPPELEDESYQEIIKNIMFRLPPGVDESFIYSLVENLGNLKRYNFIIEK